MKARPVEPKMRSFEEGNFFGRMLIKRLAKVLQLSVLYQSENQAVKRPIEELWHSIAHGKDLHIRLADDRFFVDGEYVRLNYSALALAESLKETFKKLGISEIHFDANMKMSALKNFFSRYQHHMTTQTTTSFLEESMESIQLVPISDSEPLSYGAVGGSAPHDQVLQCFARLAVSIDHMVQQTLANKEPAFFSLRREIQHLWDYGQAHKTLLLGITQRASLKRNLSYYIANVVVLTLLMAQELGCSKRTALYLAMQALTHDLGRLFLEDFGNEQQIFEKEELGAAIQKIPFSALKVLIAHDFHPENIHRMVCAFESQRGAAFKGGQLPQSALWASELIAIPAAFCRLTMPLHCQPLASANAIGAIVKYGGTYFDTIFLTAFLRMMGLYPVGSPVLLSDGKVAWVEKQIDDPSAIENPMVRVEPLAHGAQTGDVFQPASRGLHIVRALPYRGATATRDFMLA